jgi:ketosteroid isomerase-like protein
MRCIRSCWVALLIVALNIAGTTASAAQAQDPPERAEDHTALRALLAQATQALNTNNFDAIAPNLDASFTAITVDNQKLVGLDAFKAYWRATFEGPDALLKGFSAKPVADELTQFIDATTGVVYGTSEETYTFNDGDVRTMQTRWSAVVRKVGTDWKIVNAHFSTNLLDNPVLDIAKATATKLAIGAAFAGLLLGLLAMALLRRRGSSS